MKHKIKFRLIVLDHNQLVFQILEMDERFRGGRKLFRHKNADSSDIVVRSEKYISVSTFGDYGVKETGSIDLRGSNRAHDYEAVLIEVDNAPREKQRIIEALQSWAKNWEGFQNDAYSDEKHVSTVDIYTI